MPKRKKKAAPSGEIIFPEHYYVLGADLSLRRPGFCMLEIDNKDGEAHIMDIKLMSVDNKTKKNKTHGQILNEIYRKFLGFIFMPEILPDAFDNIVYFVREKMVMNKKVPSERDVAKVVGIMDFSFADKEWHEIYPVTVKALVAGSGKATKEEVAEALDKYVGKQEYANDDESDATAVAVAWLMKHKQIKEAV